MTSKTELKDLQDTYDIAINENNRLREQKDKLIGDNLALTLENERLKQIIQEQR